MQTALLGAKKAQQGAAGSADWGRRRPSRPSSGTVQRLRADQRITTCQLTMESTSGGRTERSARDWRRTGAQSGPCVLSAAGKMPYAASRPPGALWSLLWELLRPDAATAAAAALPLVLPLALLSLRLLWYPAGSL